VIRLSSADIEPADASTEVEAPATDNARTELLEKLGAAIGDALLETEVQVGVDLWARVATESWADAALVCRDQLGLRYFCYLSAIDWLPSPFGKSEEAETPAVAPFESADLERGVTGGETRFQIIARLVSPTSHLGITLKTDVPDDSMTVPSWVEVYAGADWHERETWEMFGIDFAGHPNLAHIYLPGGFEGNPLRKDFPLVSRMVKPWPGLVDVEAMPGEPDDEEGEPSEGGDDE
jgi:NADH-quinone oxidoreductase subunit C